MSANLISENGEEHRRVLARAEKYRDKITGFLRDLIRIPGTSCLEGDVILRIREEMKSCGFDEIIIDGMGNIIGRIGSGKTLIAIDAHIDTAGIGSPEEWKWDPYEGKLENGVVFGRGASDQLAGMAGAVYSGAVIRDEGLEGDYTLYVTGTVQEEDCDGLCWQYIIKEDKIRPECVVITEPTGLNVYRGHRGRMEIGVRVRGVSCHGSAPERGRNPVYAMASLVKEIKGLNRNLKDDNFLGKGSVAVSYIDCKTPSLCAVPSECYIHLDRRLTRGETRESALREVEAAAERAGINPGEIEVQIPRYDLPSYTGLVYPSEKYYPVWDIPETHRLCRAALETTGELFGDVPAVGKWCFSTNGVATMGIFGVPTVGFGPGNEIYAHTVEDQVPVEHLVKATAWYALFPGIYCRSK